MLVNIYIPIFTKNVFFQPHPIGLAVSVALLFHSWLLLYGAFERRPAALILWAAVAAAAAVTAAAAAGVLIAKMTGGEEKHLLTRVRGYNPK